MTITWMLHGGKDTEQLAELLERYDAIEAEKKEIDKEIVDFYFRIHNLPSLIVEKNVNLRWSNREFNLMLNRLRKIRKY
ncbi:hypothetical protein [Niallia sp. Krafla_26]|uniref:hypothetical protein n=1 Tax=Niallia sp. Krafla_26 TaxID=3064703 RepID=UPI003D177C7C